MRLTDAEIAIIKSLVAQHLGPAAEVRLFGSRVDDGARGGDIDLLVTVPAPVPGMAELRLNAALEAALGDQRVDLLIHAGTDTPRPIERIAYRDGVVL